MRKDLYLLKLNDNLLKLNVMNETENKEALKKGIAALVDTLEKAANITRDIHAQANGSLDDAMMRRFESLSLSVCYDLLEASAINGSL